MKHLNKILPLILTLMLVLGLATTASADVATYSVTINNEKAGHTYEAYQIFTGDLSSASENDNSEGTQAVLSNIVWGSGVTSYDDKALSETDASTVVQLLTSQDALNSFIGKLTLGTATKTVSSQTDNTYVIDGLVPGYYLIKDRDLSATAHDAYTSYIIEVVENSTVTPKSSVPTVIKKVDDKNDSDTTEDAIQWHDSADYDIGDDVPFKLTATLAADVANYAGAYKVVFHDTLSSGLTYNNDAEVKFGDKVLYNDNTDTALAGTTVTVNGNQLTITIPNVKDPSIGAGNNDKITVEYTAKLNNSAVIGSGGNPNTVYLQYSNNPNATGSTGPTGQTPEDKVIVFTYQLRVDKVHPNPSYNPTADDNDEGDDDKEYLALEGAGFTLYKKNSAGTYEKVGNEITGATTFEFKGLDDGVYKLEETTVPAGYNKAADVEFTISATHDTEASTPRLLTLVSSDNMAVEKTGEGENETFTGKLLTDVVNNAGITLPETGSIGTAIFYVVGGLLVLAAVVLLITKKRMSSAK